MEDVVINGVNPEGAMQSGRRMAGVGWRSMMLMVTMTCPPRRLTLHSQAASSRARQAGWIV